MFGKNKKVEELEYEINRRLSNLSDSMICKSEIILRSIKETQDAVKNDRWKQNDINDVVERQQRTIEVLTNALCDKYEEGLFIYSEDGKIPTVIRNGKEITDSLTQEFSINWTIGEFPNISIEQVAGTHKDMNV